MEVNPEKYMQEQLGQAQTAAGGIEAAKEKYGVKGYKAGGKITKKVKKTAKKIEEASKQSAPQPPKGDIKDIPSGYMDFGAQLDPTDKKVFLYGVKKIGDDTFLQGAAKRRKKILKANIQKGNMDVGISRQGNDKQINFTYKRTFKHGGLVCRGQGKSKKEKL